LWFFKNKLYKALLLNSIVASIIFYLLFSLWFYYEHKLNYKLMTFKVYNTDYELELSYRDSSYSISRTRINSSYSQYFEIMSGKYKTKADRIFLIDSVNTMTVYKDSLYGFAGTVALTER